MSGVIVTILNQLAEKRAAIAEVQTRIERLAADLLAERAALEKEAKALEEQAKQKAACIPVAARHTLRGDLLQLVYSESLKWDEAALSALAERHHIPQQELQACQVKGHCWSIRKVGGKG